MGAGGNLPTSITQTISLYNTTGVIEKEKIIYFSPFISKRPAKTVRERWLEEFAQVVSSPEEYKDITISTWNPTDRALTIKGNADDFRAISNLGYALNYLILTRTVVTGNTTKVHMYAFFIDSVYQAGQGSIRLELVPDDITTAFYLNNTSYLNDDLVYDDNGNLDVFNPVMKNNFVARQHYDRYKKTISSTSTSYETSVYDLSYTDYEEEGALYREFEINFDFTALTNIFVSDMTVGDIMSNLSLLKVHRKYSIGPIDYDYYSDLELDDCYSDDGKHWLITAKVRYLRPIVSSRDSFLDVTFTFLGKATFDETNLDIFSQIEESFKYKRQFRDYHKWLNYGNPDELDFTEEELEDIDNAVVWANLSVDTKEKILRKCLHFINIVLNKPNALANSHSSYLYPKTPTVSTFGTTYSDISLDSTTKYVNTKISKTLTTVVIPTFVIPKQFQQYKSNIDQILGLARIKYLNINGTELSVTGETNPYFEGARSLLSINSMYAPYIVSVYLTKESKLNEYISFDFNEVSVMSVKCTSIMNYQDMTYSANIPALTDIMRYTGDLSVTDGNNIIMTKNALDCVLDGNYYLYINESTTSVEIQKTLVNDYRAQGNHHNNLSSLVQRSYAFILPNVQDNMYVDLSEKKLLYSDIVNQFKDVVLTFNPYSFYGISYLGRIESILNKTNYYENPIVELEYKIDVTDTLKYSILPVYTLEGLKQRFYSEGLESTVTNNLMLVTSKLADYIVANQSQMKNQYAVNDLSLGYGLVTRAVQGIGDMAQKAMLMGGMGALMGGISATADSINLGITHEQDKSVIHMTQTAKMADVGHLPSNLKQLGTDIDIDLSHEELGLYLNHYTIDKVSYDSICKYLERFGYLVNIYDDLHVNTRVGWDYVQLLSFDYDGRFTVEQEESIRQIFLNGVTLLHDTNKLHGTGHNYEVALE